MERHTHLILYHSGNKYLRESNTYVYDLEISRLARGLYETVDYNTFGSREFLGETFRSTYRGKDFTITKECVLTGAPKDWLLKNNYSI